MKLTDQEAGYYLGICSHAAVLQQIVEEFQEKGVHPYQIVEYVLFTNAKLQEEAIAFLKESGFNFEETHDPK